MSLRVLSLWEAVNVAVWITMWPNSWHAGLSQREARHVSKCFLFPVLPNCGLLIDCFSPQPNPETQRVCELGEVSFSKQGSPVILLYIL